jgi:hypothetical protein
MIFSGTEKRRPAREFKEDDEGERLMGGMFSSKKPSAPPPPPPEKDDAEVQAAAAAERERQRKARGRASTILTGGDGVTGETRTARKLLLGE